MTTGRDVYSVRGHSIYFNIVGIQEYRYISLLYEGFKKGVPIDGQRR